MFSNASITRSPYDVLDISPDATERMIASAYKALARKFHPDTTSLSLPIAGQQMAELNWAKRELDQNRVYWSNVLRKSTLVPGRTRTSRVWETSLAVATRSLFVVPHMLWLPDRDGYTAVFYAYVPGISPTGIRARFNPRSFDVARLAPDGERAYFKVRRRGNTAAKTKHGAVLQIVVPDLSIAKTLHILPYAVTAPPSSIGSAARAEKTPADGGSDDWFLQRLGHVVGQSSGAR